MEIEEFLVSRHMLRENNFVKFGRSISKYEALKHKILREINFAKFCVSKTIILSDYEKTLIFWETLAVCLKSPNKEFLHFCLNFSASLFVFVGF